MMPASPFRSRRFGAIVGLGTAAALSIAVVTTLPLRAFVQEPPAPQTVPPERLQAAIKSLSDLDYQTRTAAARTVRRTPAAQAVPALITAVSEHADAYVRYKAAVLLTAFNDLRTTDVMRESLTTPNDRLRAVAYAYFEHHADPAMAVPLLAALDHETSEFVRPSLVRALAAVNGPAVQPILTREAGRGEDFFRSSVIEALGDYKARYAFDTLAAIAQLDGPLLDDAALALGKIGDPRALPILAALQRSAPQVAQPSIAAAICLLGTNCDLHEGYLRQTLKFADENQGFQELLRGAAAGLGALAIAGRTSAMTALVEAAASPRESTRAPVALALGAVALTSTDAFLPFLQGQPSRGPVIELLAEGFDMLEEDLDKERFYAVVRRTYWNAADASPTRDLMQALIGKLDF